MGKLSLCDISLLAGKHYQYRILFPGVLFRIAARDPVTDSQDFMVRDIARHARFMSRTVRLSGRCHC